MHGEMRWPGGGGIMFGSHREGNDVVSPPGHSAAYLVTDDPDKVFTAAVEAGGTVRREMVDQDYGGRGGSVADPEGNVVVVRGLPARLTEMGREPAPPPR